jgi:hypothetical protein
VSDTPQSNILAQPWEQVTLTVFFQDGLTIDSVDQVVRREDLQESVREGLLAQARETERPDLQEKAETYEMSQDEFRTHVLRVVDKALKTSVQVDAGHAHELRFLPPWAVREVVVSIDNLAPRIVIPQP